MIPDFQSLMLPFLIALEDKRPRKLNEIADKLAEKFKLTEQELKELLTSGSPVFKNRVAWARTYLKKAMLIDSPERGITVISKRGLDVLKNKPEKINIKFLRQFSEFIEFQNINQENNNIEPVIETPEEIIEKVYLDLRKSLAEDLLIKILNSTPDFFERMVVDLLVKMGYGGSMQDAGKAIGRSGDEGIDGTIKEDKLGLDIIYIQAKRWQPGNNVSRPEIQKFVGALAGQGAKKGVFITTSKFTREAKDYTARIDTKIVLVDGELLANLMIDFNVGLSIEKSYELKKIDLDYFDE